MTSLCIYCSSCHNFSPTNNEDKLAGNATTKDSSTLIQTSVIFYTPILALMLVLTAKFALIDKLFKQFMKTNLETYIQSALD